MAVQRVDSPRPAPSGFLIMGEVYQFTVNGQDHYSFNKPVTLTASKLPPANEQLTFKDSADISAWAREAVATVVQGGIMKVNPDNTFRPGAYATRAEAVTVIVNAFNK